MTPSHRIVLCPACNAKLRVRMADRAIALRCPNCSERVDVMPSDGVDEATGVPITAARQQPFSESWSEPAAPKPASRTAGMNRLATQDRRTSESSSTTREIAIVGGLLLLGLAGLAAGLKFFFGTAESTPAAITQSTPDPNSPPPATATTATAADAAGAGLVAASLPDADPTAAAPSAPLTPPPASTVPPGFAQVPPGFAQSPSPAPSGPQTPPLAPAGAPPAAGPPAAGRQLSYTWQQGEEFVYMFSIVEGAANDGRRTTGSLQYTVRGPVAGTPAEEDSTGTGFIATADGVIATCAHVVERATAIEVVLQGRVYPATVLATDAATDLALLRIAATGLTPLTLTDSDQLQLAEGVLAVGFPLSDVLGTDVKVTTGTVAGLISDPERGRRIQIDAALNPGNSGGPVVNGAGQVVGIASAKLTGADVTAVGFAAPVNQLRSLAAANGISLPLTTRAATVAREEAARQVVPAVALIRVHGRSAEASVELAYSLNFTSFVHEPNGSFTPPESHHENGTLQVNDRGGVVEFSGKEQLPAVLGPAALLALEPLGDVPLNQWTVENQTSITRVERQERAFGFGPRFRPGMGIGGFPGRFGGPPGRFGGLPGFEEPEQVIEEIPAVERSTYRTGQVLNNQIALQKTYELVAAKPGSQPYMVIRGTGNVVFDLARGVPASLDYSATIERSDESGKAKFPVTVQYNLRNREEVLRERQQAAAETKARQEKEQHEATVPDPLVVDRILADIRKAEGGFDACSHLEYLAKIAIVPEKRPDVLRVIGNHISNSDSSVRNGAAKALCHWATATEINQLKTILSDTQNKYHSFNKPQVARVVVRLGTDADRTEVFGMLQDYSIRREVLAEVIEIGSSLEPAVLKLVENVTDDILRRELIEVLQKLGTPKSIPLLEQLAAGDNPLCKSSAQRALDAIRARQ